MNSLKLAVDTLLLKVGEYAVALKGTNPERAELVEKLHTALTSIPIELLYLAMMVLAATVLLGFVVAPLAGFSTYVERRVAGRIQARIGCNRVGPEGLLQFLADGVKLLLKEDTIPHGADQALFRLAPYFVILGAFMSFATIPFGKYLFVADLNIGIFYLISISSLVVVGILIAGWSSNNKWSLLGSMRSAAQIVSYEIPVSLALLVPVLLTGSLSLQDMNEAQAGGFLSWYAVGLRWVTPAVFVAFFIYFIGALAEVNRTPFDLPEAESELVSGYNTEYSGMRWGLFFVAEYGNMFLVSAIAVTAFLGGWQPSKVNIVFGGAALFFTLIFGIKSISYLGKLIVQKAKGASIFDLLSTIRPIKLSKPMFGFLALAALAGASAMHMLARDFWLIQFMFFVAKVYFFVFVIIWIRWTLPRIRIDQMMDLCWKKLVPIAFGCLFWTAAAMLLQG